MMFHRRARIGLITLFLASIVAVVLYNRATHDFTALNPNPIHDSEQGDLNVENDLSSASNTKENISSNLNSETKDHDRTIPQEESSQAQSNSHTASSDDKSSSDNDKTSKNYFNSNGEITDDDLPLNDDLNNKSHSHSESSLSDISDAESKAEANNNSLKEKEKEINNTNGMTNTDTSSDESSKLTKPSEDNEEEDDEKKTIPSLEKEEKLLADPATPEESQYAANEAEDLENEETKKALEDLLEKYKSESIEEEEISNPNPPDFTKDYSIKIPEKLSTVTPQQLTEGNSNIHDFFGQIIDLIQSNRLSYPVEERLNMVNGKTVFDNILFYESDTDILSEEESSTFLHFSEKFVEDLKGKHKIVTDNLPDVDPTFYSGDGYVIVGGGKYSWFSMLVIETLRKLGSVLPVEIIIPTKEDYEPDFCKNVLPKYNAKCVCLYDVFGEKLNDITLTGYQYKSFALLASSFENAFLLDSDTYPVTNPDLLFTSELYTTVKMITWPDYWRRTTSPVFYEIRGTELGGRVRHLNDLWTDKKFYQTEYEDISEDILKKNVPLHDRKGTIPDFTTESGEMMINKKLHFKTLLLALYYNFDGQFGYYPLLSQGGAGEGDKETFVAAANYYSLTYYQVYKKPDRAYGYYKDGFYIDTSIIQYNPIKDHSVLIEVLQKIQEDQESPLFVYEYSTYFTDNFQIHNSEPLFYHVHETKIDPFHLVDIKATFDLEGSPLRNMGGDWPRFDFDLELFLWETVNKHVCQHKTHFVYFDDKDYNSVCDEYIDTQLDFLRQTNYLFLKEYHDSIPFDNLRRIQSSKYIPK